MSNKLTQSIPRHELKELLKVSRGEKKANLVIKQVSVLDLVNGGLEVTDVAIYKNWIAGTGNYDGEKELDGKGLIIVPGFIDSHLHIESSLMNPFEFEKVTLPRGTTTCICDPHEITNVLGSQGFEWFLRSAEIMTQNLFVQVSSCVPALKNFETNFGTFTIDQMKNYKNHSHVIGLAEMMNFPGVIQGDDEVLDKVEEFSTMNLDGHSPLLRGKELNAYRACGIQNCHETVTIEEAKEKLKIGMGVMLREGSVAKNLKNLSPVINDFNSINCLLCTDDRNPYEVYHEGHIDYLVKLLIQECHVPAHVAYRLSSYSAARHFGLKRLGLIAPGYVADFILLNRLETVDIHSVYKNGIDIRDLDLVSQAKLKYIESKPPIKNTMFRQKLSSDQFEYQYENGKYNVIEVIPNEIITNHLKVQYNHHQFQLEDILKIVVVERYGKERPLSKGLIHGFQFKNAAIASSVAHDSHNIIVVGDSSQDMCLATNTLIESGGGFVVVSQGKILASLSLPIAGLMSELSAEEITTKLTEIKKALTTIGCPLHEPFLQMAFVALPVIPSLKITDHGLINVLKMEVIGLKD
jgi:adenine deaminase